MYECLTSNPPFRGENFFVTMMMHGDLPPAPFPASLGISNDLENIVLKALHKNPDDRYQTMEEMRKDLVSISNEEPDVAPTKNAFKKSTKSSAQSKPDKKTKGQNKSLITALAFLVVILIAAGAGTYFINRKMPKRPPPPAPPAAITKAEEAKPPPSTTAADDIRTTPSLNTTKETSALPLISSTATMPEQDHGLSAAALKEKGADLARQITSGWQDPMPALYLTAAIQADPNDADGYQKLAGYYWDEKDRAPQADKPALLEKCLVVYSAMLKQIPDSYDGHALRSSVEVEMQLYQAALSDITAALKVRPDSHDLLLRHAFVLREMHQYAQAIAEYDKNIGPQDVDHMFVEGMCYEDLKQYDKAIEFASKWIKQLGEAPYLYQVRADSERMLGRYKEAFLDYQNMTDMQKRERNDWIEECRAKMTLPVVKDQVPSSQ